MSETSKTVSNALANSFRDFGSRVNALAEPLSENQFWTKPYSYGNSFGHLTLHVIGNLNYYIGAQIAQTGYIRDREREFTEQSAPPKKEVINQLNKAINLVVTTLAAQTDQSWSENYEAVATPDFVKDRFSVFLRCATHCHHHLGQMIYLAKELSK
jgi:DinB superfamily